MPVLPEPDHLVHDALQRGKQGGVELTLHVHDPAAAPHGSGGTDGARVRRRVGLGSRRTGLLLARVWEKKRDKSTWRKRIDFCRTLYCSMWMFWENSSHTALVALPLLDFQRQVQGSDRKVHCLRVDTSHLRETVADYISDRPCGLGSEREWETLCWHVLKLLCDSAGFWKWNRRGKAMRWTNIKGRLKPWLNMTLAKSLSSPSVHFLLFGDLLCPWTASQREVSGCLML